MHFAPPHPLARGLSSIVPNNPAAIPAGCFPMDIRLAPYLRGLRVPTQLPSADESSVGLRRSAIRNTRRRRTTTPRPLAVWDSRNWDHSRRVAEYGPLRPGIVRIPHASTGIRPDQIHPATRGAPDARFPGLFRCPSEKIQRESSPYGAKRLQNAGCLPEEPRGSFNLRVASLADQVDEQEVRAGHAGRQLPEK